jgi:hypothetical protein
MVKRATVRELMRLQDSDLFVVSYLATPIIVVASEREAQEFIDDKEDTEYWTYHKVPWMGMYISISEAFGWMATQQLEKQPKMPNSFQALDWMVSEVGEAVGARVNMEGDWYRNNDHEGDDYVTEIGQAIMMGIIALGVVDPINVVRAQLKRWGWKDANPRKQKTIYDILEEYHDEQSKLGGTDGPKADDSKDG